jgi:hypothetical protein
MSKIKKIILTAIIVLLGSMFVTSLTDHALGGELLDKATGKVEVQDQTMQGKQPATVPQTILIQDFELDYGNVQSDPGLIDRLESRPRVLPIPKLRQKDDPEQKAKNLVNLMSESLQKNFNDAGIMAQRVYLGNGLPKEGWLVKGVFTEVDEGGRLKRAGIGFGAGATNMEVQVSVIDLAVNPDAPFIIFGTVKDPKQMPGAVVTLNPYVAAAKFVLEKNAPEKDVKKTGKAIAQEIMKYREQLKQAPGATPAGK